MFRNKFIFTATLLFMALLFSVLGFAQNGEEEVRISPMAKTFQTIGFTDVEIVYSRPGVKGRTIWGGLVPYHVVWRAGANEATKIIFKDDVYIEGKRLKKGEYSFFAVPTKYEWTLIFNRVADQWGAYEYNEAEDALRIKVKPVQSNFEEWLLYRITKTSDNEAVVSLNWEKLKVPFKIKVDLK